MGFICVICRDLLEISEEAHASPRHSPLKNGHVKSTSGNQHASNNTPTHNNNVLSGRKKEKNNSIVATYCGHLYHYPCLSTWLSQSMNLTSDSKMRCPSCKQLIYIYELIQLFPVENGVGNGTSGTGCSRSVDQLLSSSFQRDMQGILDQLENLMKNWEEKKIPSHNLPVLESKECNGGSPVRKGESNSTPVRLRCGKNSPKKAHTPQYLTDLMKELDSVRKSMNILSICIEQHAELGSVVERQSKQISELRTQNEQLMRHQHQDQQNQKTLKGLKSIEIEKNPEELKDQEGDGTDKVTQKETDSLSSKEIAQQLLQQQLGSSALQSCTVDNTSLQDDIKTAQGANGSPVQSDPITMLRLKSESSEGKYPPLISDSPAQRKSVTFLDPFDELDESVCVKSNTPFNKKDLRIGDKVLWSFEGNSEVGTVKWKGFIGSQINVGVEFERQLGLPIKDLSCDPVQCIFKSKPGHGRLIPVDELSPFEKTTGQQGHNPTDFFKFQRAQNYKDSETPVNKRTPICTQQ